MKLYQSIGPSPRIVLMFIAEKAIQIDRQYIDLPGGENRKSEYLAKNPFGQTPMLELDNGSYLLDGVAICEYLEEKHPEPAMIGHNAEQRATVRALIRRLDSDLIMPLGLGFRHGEGYELFKDRVRCQRELADGMKLSARDGMETFDRWLDGRQWMAGNYYSLADIVPYCWLSFCAKVGQPIPENLTRLLGWMERMNQRPAAEESANPKSGLAEADNENVVTA